MSATKQLVITIVTSADIGAETAVIAVRNHQCMTGNGDTQAVIRYGDLMVLRRTPQKDAVEYLVSREPTSGRVAHELVLDAAPQPTIGSAATPWTTTEQ